MEANTIKLFKTLLILIPCLILTVLVIIALPEKDRYIIDIEGDLDAYQDPKLVNNSDIGFFYKNEQLTEYRNKKKPDKANVIKMSENIVTSDFTKQEISPLPSSTKTYTGPTNLVMSEGKVTEYLEKTEEGFVLKGGKTVSKEDTFEIILNKGVWGSNPSVPHRIEKINKYYAAFTEETQSVYFEFTSSNEFASIRVSELTGQVQWTLLDENMKPLKNGFNASGSIDINWKGRGSATYYLKLSGSYSKTLSPFCVQLPSDSNEWLWQMVYAEKDVTINGKFDYYGDEDFFVLPESITSNMDKSVVSFTSIPADTNVVIYDKDRKILAQYLQKKDAASPLSLYALKGAYAMSLYSFDGQAAGASYSFSLSYINTLILDIQTYGFALSPKYSDEIDYYTATIENPAGKQITEIMTTVPTSSLKIKVSQQCGYEYFAKVGQELDLSYGRNTITITFETSEGPKEIVIVVSYKANQVYTGYYKSGESVFVVDDNPENNRIMIEKKNGETAKINRTELFTYVETQMPDSYKEKIEALKKAHPNWKFTFVHTGYDFNAYVNTQDATDTGGTPISTINGKRASKDEVAFYVDPRNFLTEQYIFMFEKQLYKEGIYSAAGIKSIWAEKPEAVLSEDTFASYFAEAGKSTGLSTYFITARAALESGHGTSNLALGKITGCEGYYNYYGINAKNANPSAGGTFAKEHGWNTRRKAIIEGAAWIKKDYIGSMQYSAYFMKFSFIPKREWHQYMTDLKAPLASAQDYYKAHANGGTLNDAIEFVIPVFSNMP